MDVSAGTDYRRTLNDREADARSMLAAQQRTLRENTIETGSSDRAMASSLLIKHNTQTDQTEAAYFEEFERSSTNYRRPKMMNHLLTLILHFPLFLFADGVLGVYKCACYNPDLASRTGVEKNESLYRQKLHNTQESYRLSLMNSESSYRSEKMSTEDEAPHTLSVYAYLNSTF